MISPDTVSELSNALRGLNDEDQQVEKLSIANLNRVIRHAPEDLTVTVESGVTLGALQNHLADSGQWLPLDPPGADTLTIRDLLDRNLSGPRRFGFGTARDWVIGLKAVLADGRIIESGGTVVKNVAGYDLHKLLIGARGELAVIAEVTFKVNPLPKRESFFATTCADLHACGRLLRDLLTGPLDPHVLDMHTVGEDGLKIVVGFCGSSKQVDWQTNQLPDEVEWCPTDLRYSELFFSRENGANIKRSSVLPSELTNALESVSNAPFIARAGNGIFFHIDREPTPVEFSDVENQIRELFDPSSRLRNKVEVRG